LTDQSVLADIAKNDKYLDVGEAAIEKLSDKIILADFANNDKDMKVLKVATEKLKDKTVLADLVLEREKEEKFNNMIYELVEMYYSIEKGFSSNSENEIRIKTIGEQLNKLGGFEIMKKGHAEFSRQCNIYGAPRNLEHKWDGIGKWLG
jgi:hypothetical protein